MSYDALYAVSFVQGFMSMDIEYFVGGAECFEGFEMEQQIVQLFQLSLH